MRTVFFRLFLIIFAVALLGAGCDKPVKAPQAGIPTPKPPVVQNNIPPVTTQVETTTTEPTSTEPISVACPIPITAADVKSSCGLTGEVTLMVSSKGCTFLTTMGKTKYKYPILYTAIKNPAGFGAAPGSNLNAVAEAQRINMNKGLEQSGAQSLGFYTCDKWETEIVANLGDEAIMTPLTLLGCDKSRVLSISERSKAASLFIRKGDKIAQIASYEKGCSPDEITKIAKDYIMPEL